MGKRPSTIKPFRGSQPPQWPFAINSDSPQAEGLVRWYTAQAFPTGSALLDQSQRYEPTADATFDSASVTRVTGRESDHAVDVSAAGMTAGQTGSTSGAYTWAIWMESTAAPGTANVEKIFDNANITENQMFVWSHNAGGAFNQSAYHRDGSAIYKKAQIVSTLAANTKYLVCGSWDGVDKLRVYLDGALEATTTGVTTSIAPVGSLLFSSGGTAFFPGRIYEFRAYNRLLSDAEVAQLYEPATRFDLYRVLRPRAMEAVLNLSPTPATATLTLTTFAPNVLTPLTPFTANLLLTTYAPTVNISAPGTVITGSVMQIDWNNDGDFSDTGEDVTGRLLDTQEITCVRGKDQIRLLSPPMAGALGGELNNASRDYSTENTGSPLYGNLKPGRKVRLTLTANATNYNLFTGLLDDLPQHTEWGRRTVEIPSLGSLSRLRGKRISTELFESITTGAAMTAILDAAGWPALERSIQTGQTTLNQFWVEDEDAYDAVVRVLNTEGPGASVYESGTGFFVFEDRHSRLTMARATSSQFTFRDTNYIAGGAGYQYDSGIRDIINACDVQVTTRSAKPESVIWQYGQPLILTNNEVRVIKAEFGDPAINVQTPDPSGGSNSVQRLSILGTSPQIRLSFRDAQTTDIGPPVTASGIQSALEALGTIGSGNVVVSTVTIAPDVLIVNVAFQGTLAHQPIELLGTAGVGTTGKPLEVKIADSTVGTVDDYVLLSGAVASVTLDRTSGASVDLTITAGAAGAYLTGLQLRGQLVSSDSNKRIPNTLDASVSITAFGLRSSSPTTVEEISEEQALQLADNIVRYFQDPRPIINLPLMGVDGTVQLQQLTREISDRVTIIEAQTGVSSDWFIEQIGHSITFADRRGGTLQPLLRTHFGCEKVGNLTIGGGGDPDLIARVDSARVDISQVGA